MSRKKNPNFGQLLDYINKGKQKNNPAIFHNLRTNKDNLKSIKKEFSENYFYSAKRKNGVIFYHEIISFSVYDKEKITLEVLDDLGREYLRLRAGQALGYAKAHLDKDSIHLHFVISGNLIGSRKKLHLSRKKFNAVKEELEQIQKERYPELCNSVVFGKEAKKKRRKKNRGEVELERRFKEIGKGDLTEKEKISIALKRCLQLSQSERSFSEMLKKNGLAFYRRGKTVGVKDQKTEKKHRFKTLGLLEEYERIWECWEKLPDRATDLKKIDKHKKNREFQELGFKKDIIELLEKKSVPDSDLPAWLKKRHDELRRVAKLQRQIRRDVFERWER